MKNSLDLKRFHFRSVLSASLKIKQYTFFMAALKLICTGISKKNSKSKNRSSFKYTTECFLWFSKL